MECKDVERSACKYITSNNVYFYVQSICFCRYSTTSTASGGLGVGGSVTPTALPPLVRPPLVISQTPAQPAIPLQNQAASFSYAATVNAQNTNPQGTIRMIILMRTYRNNHGNNREHYETNDNISHAWFLQEVKARKCRRELCI